MRIIVSLIVVYFIQVNVWGQPGIASVISKRLDSCVVTIYTYDYNNKQNAVGSGVIINSKGYILSNAHLFDTWNRAEVFNEHFKKRYEISQEAFFQDKENDLAIFKIDTSNLKFITLGNSDLLEKGESVFCMGSPQNLTNTFTDGLISGFRSFSINTNDRVVKDFIQFSAPIFEGSSGGALVSMKGELIGVPAGSIQEIRAGFAIPVNRIRSVLKSISGFSLSTLQTEIKSVNDSSFRKRYPYKTYIVQNGKKVVAPAAKGTISVYTNCPDCLISIWLDEKFIGTLDKYVVSGMPKCGSAGALVTEAVVGKHKLTAKDSQNGYIWEFDLKPLLENECLPILVKKSLKN